MKKVRRHGRRLRILCTLLILLAGCGENLAQNKITAEQTIKTPDDQTPPANETVSTNHSERSFSVQRFLHSAEKDLNDLPGIIIDETNEMLSDWNNVWPLLTVGGASITMHNTTADREIAENFNLNRALSTDVDEAISNLGGPGLHFGAAGLWYAISAGSQDQLNKAVEIGLIRSNAQNLTWVCLLYAFRETG